MFINFKFGNRVGLFDTLFEGVFEIKEIMDVVFLFSVFSHRFSSFIVFDELQKFTSINIEYILTGGC